MYQAGGGGLVGPGKQVNSLAKKDAWEDRC